MSLVRSSAIRKEQADEQDWPLRGDSLVAWHGVGGVVPASWSIVAVSGSADQGYLRVDGPREQSAEFRWQRVRRLPDLEGVAEQYLRQVKKISKKKKLVYEGGLQTGKRRPKDRPRDLMFEWQAERQGMGRLYWCPECRRTIIAQISAPEGYPVRDVAPRILGTVRDHTADKEMVEWGVYGLVFEVPKELRLIRQRLMSGFLSMNFASRRKRVIIERWGLADALLDEGGFWQWHSREYLAELKRFSGETSVGEWHDHEALETQGVEGGMRRVVSIVRAGGVPRFAERFASIAWHCPETNRIVGVRCFDRDPYPLAGRVAATVRCHG